MNIAVHHSAITRPAGECGKCTASVQPSDGFEAHPQPTLRLLANILPSHPPPPGKTHTQALPLRPSPPRPRSAADSQRTRRAGPPFPTSERDRFRVAVFPKANTRLHKFVIFNHCQRLNHKVYPPGGRKAKPGDVAQPSTGVYREGPDKLEKEVEIRWGEKGTCSEDIH